MENGTSFEYPDRPLNVWGLVVLIIYYIILIVAGIWASVRNKTMSSNDADDIILAGRNIGPVVGIITMTATWVEGGSLNGTAEFVFTPGYGLAWTQTVWGYCIALVLGGIFYAGKMRKCRYVTMLDPFKERYGEIVAALVYVPLGIGDLFFTAAGLSALGSSLTIIIGIPHTTGIIISTAVAVFYTMIGGLYSLVITDVLQFICMVIGLWLSAGFALAHPAVQDLAATALGSEGWVGKLDDGPQLSNWVDLAITAVFGGIPWQDYFLRVLSAKTPRDSQVLSIAGAIGSVFCNIPAVIIGAVAKSTDWNSTTYPMYGSVPLEPSSYPLILPLVLEHLTPKIVSIIGLGALSAAIMSSVAASDIASSAMMSRNVYKPIRRRLYQKRQVTDSEILIVMRVCIILHGAISCMMAIKILSIFELYILAGDFVYVVAFPQLTCVIFYKHANAFGAVCGYVASFFFRIVAGGQFLDFRPLIYYPLFDEDSMTQLFPFRTLAMMIGMLTIIVISYITKDMETLQNIFKTCDGTDETFDEGRSTEASPKINVAYTSDQGDQAQSCKRDMSEEAERDPETFITTRI